MADEKDAKPRALLPEYATNPHVRVIELRELLGDAREIILIHAGEGYRLRITGKNKLILTK